MDLNKLNSFLKFGYFLDYSESKFSYDFNEINKSKFDCATEQDLIKMGSDKLKNAIHKNYKNRDRNVVPISGGLDSRAILAGLLECTESTNIETYTFGTPNTLDFEIGNKVAKVLGTKHRQISFVDYQYTLDELLETSNRTGNQTTLFSTIPLSIIDGLFGDASHWTGAFAGPPTGNVLLENPSENLELAKNRFIKHKYTPVKSINLNNYDESELRTLLDMIFITPQKVTYDEQLHMNFAQKKWIAPHLLVDGFHYKIPFMDKELMDFMFSLNNQYRLNQNMYKKILIRSYPKEFNIETKSNFACSLYASNLDVFFSRVKNKLNKVYNRNSSNYIDPYLNYIDFNDGIRSRKDIHDIIKSSIYDLKKRNLIEWIDIEKIWKDHVSNNRNHADALLVLASLEIHLKAGKE